MLLVFLFIAVVSGSFFVVSMFLGDHDVSDALTVDHHGGGDSAFSLRSMFAFGSGFGGVGAIATSYGAPVTASILLGAAFGLIAIWFNVRLAKTMLRMQGDSTLRADDLIGQFGHITQAVPADSGFGQVLVHDRAGRSVYRRAIADTGSPVSEGARVAVVDVRGDIVIVKQR